MEAMNGFSRQLIHFTRNWLHYGIPSLVVFCALVGAFENLLAR
ncbi:MAG: hypothetical protein ABFD86_08980 [Bryobacteraceae bacterium]